MWLNVPENETARSMAEMMMGENLVSPNGRTATVGSRLEIKDLMQPTHQHGTDLRAVNLQVRAGRCSALQGSLATASAS